MLPITGILGLVGLSVNIVAVAIIRIFVTTYGDLALERKLYSNWVKFLQFASELVISVLIMFVYLYIIINIDDVDSMKTFFEKSELNDENILIGIVSVILAIVAIVISKGILGYLNPKYEYFVVFENQKENEWKLIKHSEKNGYMIMKENNDEKLIRFITDTSSVIFKQKKIKDSKINFSVTRDKLKFKNE